MYNYKDISLLRNKTKVTFNELNSEIIVFIYGTYYVTGENWKVLYFDYRYLLHKYFWKVIKYYVEWSNDLSEFCIITDSQIEIIISNILLFGVPFAIILKSSRINGAP